jgi:hypothetical protein
VCKCSGVQFYRCAGVELFGYVQEYSILRCIVCSGRVQSLNYAQCAVQVYTYRFVQVYRFTMKEVQRCTYNRCTESFFLERADWVFKKSRTLC